MMNVRIKLRKNQSTIPTEKLTEDIHSLEILGEAIEELPDLSHLKECRHVLLVCPQLTKMPKVPSLLKILKIKGGHFKLPSDIEKQTELRTLSLQGLKSQKESFSSWSLPIGLENCDLASNDMTNLPKNIGELINLQRLTLDHNQLQELPSEVYELNGLNHLSLDGNPLSDSCKQKLYDKFNIWF
jgi:Leucine-rich repeat (LRR) protein